MELIDILRLLRRYWRSTIILTIASLAVSGALLVTLPKTFTAQAQVFLTVLTGNTGSDLASGSNYSQNQVDSLAKVATSPMVLNPVIEELNLSGTDASELSRFVNVSVPAGTAIMVINANASDPASAAHIANTVSKNLVKAVDDLSPVSTEGGRLVRATIISQASPPETHSSPSTRDTVLLGLLVGLALGFGQAFLRFVLDRRIHDEEEIGSLTDAPIMGRISKDPELADTSAARASISRLTAEDYRRLRTNLQFISAENDEDGVENHAKTFVITSSVPNEGKTTIAYNLACVLAEAGEKVLLIDGDLRRPRIAKYLGLENSVGLTTVLIGRATSDSVLQKTQIENLTVMASGAIPPNPSELLGSKAMKHFLESVEKLFTYIIIDSAPLLPVTDASILAQHTDGALVVANTRTTTVDQLESALGAIKDANGNILGIVLNKIVRGKGYANSYTYQYGEEYADISSDESSAPKARRQKAKRHKGRK